MLSIIVNAAWKSGAPVGEFINSAAWKSGAPVYLLIFRAA